MKNREARGEDFDKDLSEMEEEEEKSEIECDCDSDDLGCDCDLWEESESELESDISCTDRMEYYDLKEIRDGRKREKLSEREAKERTFKLGVAKEEEVRIAYESLIAAEKAGKTIPIRLTDIDEWTLFGSEHTHHCFDARDSYASQKVYFWNPERDGPVKETKLGGKDEMLHGGVHLRGNGHLSICRFGPFQPPKQANPTPIKVKSCDGDYELSLIFIRSGLLKLRVPREVVFMTDRGVRRSPYPPDAPEVFEFVGTTVDYEEEQREKRIVEGLEELPKAKARSPSPPSPRETWFEMNHPMGWWKSGW